MVKSHEAVNIDTEISDAATELVERVRQLVQQAQEMPSLEVAEAEEQNIADIYTDFFKYSIAWTVNEKKKYQGQENIPQADVYKKKGVEALEDLRENMRKYAVCYMRLYRSMGAISQEMRERERKIAADAKVQWTSETGTLMQRYRKEREALTESNAFLRRVLILLESSDPYIIKVETLSRELFGEKAEDFLRPFRSALRKSDFKTARKKISALDDVKKKFSLGKRNDEAVQKEIQNAALTYIAYLEEHHNDLTTSDSKIFLKGAEASVIIAAQEKEIEQKNDFLKKYYHPYMEYKLKSLHHLREKLLVIGSLEGLITLYIRLIRGLAEPFSDIKALRIFEEEVILHLYYLLDGPFQEIDKIEERNIETMREFYEDLKEFESA